MNLLFQSTIVTILTCEVDTGRCAHVILRLARHKQDYQGSVGDREGQMYPDILTNAMHY